MKACLLPASIFGYVLVKCSIYGAQSNSLHRTYPSRKQRSVRYIPIKHNDIWEFYKKAEASFWTAEEIDLSQDLKDWKNLNDGERHFITHILAFLLPAMGLSMRTSPSTLYLRCSIRRRSFFMVFKLRWRIFTLRPILCSLTPMLTMRSKRIICFTRLRRWIA